VRSEVERYFVAFHRVIDISQDVVSAAMRPELQNNLSWLNADGSGQHKGYRPARAAAEDGPTDSLKYR